MNREHDKPIDELLKDLQEEDYGIPEEKTVDDARGRGGGGADRPSATVKVLPETPNAHLEALERNLAETLPESVRIGDTGREELAFGLSEIVFELVAVDDDADVESVVSGFETVDVVEDVTVERSGF